jgi:hypothetical protein
MQRRKFITIAGGALMWPLVAYGQRKPMPVVGYLHFAAPGYVPTADPFLQGLKEFGYAEGHNMAVEYRWAEGHYDRLPALAADLVGLKVDRSQPSVRRRRRLRKMLHPASRSFLRLGTTPWKRGWSPASPGPAAMPRASAFSSPS